LCPALLICSALPETSKQVTYIMLTAPYLVDQLALHRLARFVDAWSPAGCNALEHEIVGYSGDRRSSDAAIQLLIGTSSTDRRDPG
jgi:hypothetical protein